MANLDLTADNKIYMRPDLYNERTARAHIKKLKEILYTPGVLNLSNDISDSISSAFATSDKDESENTKDDASSNATKVTEEGKTQSEKPKPTDQPEEATPTDVKKEEGVKANEDSKLSEDDKTKQSEEEYNKLIKNYKDALQDTKNSLPSLNIDKQTIELDKIFENVLEKEMASFEPVK